MEGNICENASCESCVPFVSSGLRDRKSTRLNSSHLVISYAVFCLKKKNIMDFRLHVLLPSELLRLSMSTLSRSSPLTATFFLPCCVAILPTHILQFVIVISLHFPI